MRRGRAAGAPGRVSAEGPVGNEVAAEQDQRDAGQLLGALAEMPADQRAEGQPELAGDQGQHADGDDHGHGRQAGQAEAEADGQLIQADAHSQRDHAQTARCGHPACRLLVIVAADQHPDPDPDYRRGGHIVGRAADQPRQAAAGGKPDQRHSCLEGDEDQRDAQPGGEARGAGSAERGGHGERVQAQREDESQQPQQHAANPLMSGGPANPDRGTAGPPAARPVFSDLRYCAIAPLRNSAIAQQRNKSDSAVLAWPGHAESGLSPGHGGGMSEDRPGRGHVEAPPRPRIPPPRSAGSRRTLPPHSHSKKPPRRSLPVVRQPARLRRARWRELSTLAKIGYTSATMLTALAVAISLVAYGLYLKLDRNLNVANVGGLTHRSEYGVQNILILGSQTRDGQGRGFGYDPHTNLSDN